MFGFGKAQSAITFGQQLEICLSCAILAREEEAEGGLTTTPSRLVQLATEGLTEHGLSYKHAEDLAFRAMKLLHEEKLVDELAARARIAQLNLTEVEVARARTIMAAEVDWSEQLKKLI